MTPLWILFGADIPGGVLLAVGVGDGAQYAAGITDGEAVRRDIFSNDAARTNDAARADSDAGKDAYLCANPNVVFYINGFVALQTLIALLDIQGVDGGIKTTVGAYKDVVAENYGRAGEHYATFVDKDVIAK